MTPRTLAAEIAVPAQYELAEGPVWDAARGLLRWVDILPGHVHALDPATGALTRGGGLVLALVDRFAMAGHDGRDLRPLGGFTVDRSVIRFNDGKPDPWGNFWAGTMAWDEQNGPPCSLYCLAPDGAAPRRRHLRVHSRRNRSPAILVRCLT